MLPDLADRIRDPQGFLIADRIPKRLLILQRFLVCLLSNEDEKKCRGPGTNGSRHPLHHQGRGINPSGAMRCALALCKPSSNQQGRPIFAEPARAEASSAECHTFPLLSVTLALTGKWARGRFMVSSCGRTTNYGRRTAYTADHPCIPKPHKPPAS